MVRQEIFLPKTAKLAAMEEDDFISKTRRKREARDLQDLGAALVKLSKDQLARIDMPENLRDAVQACRSITKHEAKRRQHQYIGKIMRDIDAGPIAAQLAELEAPSKRQTALFHVAERWRTDLMESPDAIARFVKEYPQADPHRLRELAEGAREEKSASKPLRKYRELYHVLNALLQDHARRHP
jgi:ribosome-associated protein